MKRFRVLGDGDEANDSMIITMTLLMIIMVIVSFHDGRCAPIIV